jgi:hypothetical protein
VPLISKENVRKKKKDTREKGKCQDSEQRTGLPRRLDSLGCVGPTQGFK